MTAKKDLKSQFLTTLGNFCNIFQLFEKFKQSQIFQDGANIYQICCFEDQLGVLG